MRSELCREQGKVGVWSRQNERRKNRRGGGRELPITRYGNVDSTNSTLRHSSTLLQSSPWKKKVKSLVEQKLEFPILPTYPHTLLLCPPVCLPGSGNEGKMRVISLGPPLPAPMVLALNPHTSLTWKAGTPAFRNFSIDSTQSQTLTREKRKISNHACKPQIDVLGHKHEDFVSPSSNEPDTVRSPGEGPLGAEPQGD